MSNTRSVTQRAEHSTVMDRLAIDDLITGYAVALDDGDWDAYRRLFTTDGRADHRAAGGIEGDHEETAAWLAETLCRFPVRQHLIVNRRFALATQDGGPGDTAAVQADYLSTMRPEPAPPVTSGDRAAGSGTGGAVTDRTTAGRYAFTARRTADGWRLAEVVVRETWRQAGTTVG